MTSDLPTEINTFLLSCSLPASAEQVYAALTQAEHLQHWWAPSGHTLQILSLDLQVGGLFHYAYHPKPPHPADAAAQPSSYGRWRYQHFNAPEQIAFVQAYASSDGFIVPAPQPSWPFEVFYIWTLQEFAGQTLLTLEGYPVHATPTQLATFEAAHNQLQQEWRPRLDHLYQHLSSSDLN